MLFKRKKDTKPPLYLQNTLTGKKEIFKPLETGKVKMYNCGPTVYNEPHIGNLRAYIFADVLRRTLKYNGYEVHQVINITDVGHLVADSEDGEDKMEKRAKETGKTTQDIAKEITNIYFENLKSLNIDIEHITFAPATDYITEQIAMIKTLIEKGYAYQVDNGVAFDVQKFNEYGKMARINIDELQAGARVKEDPQKHHPADFWLWKFNTSSEKRQQEWDSPWGVGFPGWHIECSAISRALLGKQIDIHTGGIDHIPVHHTNEIAQSEAASGKKFANYWLHNEFLMFDGKRFEKSTGHVVYLRQLATKGYSPLALRYVLLTSKYDVEQNFTWEALEASGKALQKLRLYYAENLMDAKDGTIDKEYQAKFLEAINDNLSTPRALALLWELVKDDSVKPENKKITIQDFDKILGLQIAIHKKDGSKLKVKKDTTPDEVIELIKQRKDARVTKDWVKSDELRDKIKEFGYTVIDKNGEQKLSLVS